MMNVTERRYAIKFQAGKRTPEHPPTRGTSREPYEFARPPVDTHALELHDELVVHVGLNAVDSIRLRDYC